MDRTFLKEETMSKDQEERKHCSSLVMMCLINAKSPFNCEKGWQGYRMNICGQEEIVRGTFSTQEDRNNGIQIFAGIIGTESGN